MLSFFLRFNIYSFFLVTEKPSIYLNSTVFCFPGNDQRYWTPLYSALSWLKCFRLTISMLVTDVEHGLCWLQRWDFGNQFETLATKRISSPTSLSPFAQQCWVNTDANRLQEFHYEDKPPKLYLYEECKLKCAEYDGLPSAFHKYEQVISKREMKILNRGDDRSSNAKLFFVDSHYDFSRAEWYSGGLIFIISCYKTRIQASKDFLIGFGIKTIHTPNTIFQFWTID